jgi:hypothetical protein
MTDAFEQRCRPRDFDEVCVLAFNDDCSTDDVSWFSVGVDSRVRAGVRGFVFELVQFSRRRSLEVGLGHLIHFMVPTYRVGGVLNWLHGERFVAEWKRLRLLGIPPQNFETEAAAIDALKSAFQAERIRADLPRRLTNCGLSFARIANAAGLFEIDVRRIASGQQKPSNGVALLISSTLDSFTSERK